MMGRLEYLANVGVGSGFVFCDVGGEVLLGSSFIRSVVDVDFV